MKNFTFVLQIGFSQSWLGLGHCKMLISINQPCQCKATHKLLDTEVMLQSSNSN